MDGGDDFVWLGELQKGVVEPDLDAREVKGVVTELNGLAAEIGWDEVAIATEREGARLGDLAGLAVEKSLAQLLRVGGTGRGGGVLAMPFERRLAGLGVQLVVVDDLQPGQERLVELAQ